MAIRIKIPTVVGTGYTPPTVWKGGKKLGELHSRPKVLDGKLFAGKLILAVRDKNSPGYENVGPETLLFTTSPLGKPQLEVHYEDDYAIYELWDDHVYWSDGPPHPHHLQLAVRRSVSAGVQEPQVR